MKRILSALMVLFVMASCACADVEISAANFPDNIFRAYVRETCDDNNDGILTDEDLEYPGWIDVSGQGISSLKGIEFFTGLNGLNCENNNLTGTLDLSRNTALTWLSCSDNQLESLNITGCINLEYVYCSNNQLTGNLNLGGRAALKEAYFNNNKLTGTVNVSGCTSLTHLNLDTNSLTGTLDLSSNPALIRVWCGINQLEHLNITGCMNLERLNCIDNRLTGTLDLSGRTRLTYVNCNTNHLEHLNLTGCMALEEVRCNRNELTGTLDLSGRTALKNLRCANNHFESVNVTGCTALEELNCGFNSRITESFDNYVISHGIASLDVSTCTALRVLNCYNNSILQLDVSKNLLLEELNCEDNWYSGNSIKNLDVSNNVNLTYLNCAYNNIDVLDVSRNSKLVHLDCGNNNLHSLNLQNNPALEYLDFRGSYLTEIDLSRNTALKELYCFVNELQTLDLSRNTNLEIIECHRNSLSALNLAGHTSLKVEEAVIKHQTVKELNIAFSADNVEYPYSLNLNDYMTSSQINGIIVSTIKGLNDEDEEISSSYADGIIRFSEYPAKVKYNYGTGLGNLSMDVMITSGDTYTGMTSYKNHVYRIITKDISWPQAKEYCESLGGHLLTITSREEHDVLERMLADAYHSELGLSYKSSSCFWVGGEKKNDSWQWITGEEVTDTDSSSRTGIPSTTADYLMITFMGNYAVPNASLQRRYFICEWDSIPVESAPLSEQFMLYSADPEAYYDGLEFYGAIPEPTDLSHLEDNPPVNSSVNDSVYASALPSRYDLRDYGHITDIKNQDPYGTCWAFASIGAIESNYLVQNPGGTVPDLSELHLAWFAFRDSRQGYSFPLNYSDKHILNQGGFHSMPVAMFSRMSGPALESDLPYSRASNVNTLTSGRLPESYTRPFKLKDAYTIGKINESNRDFVKNIVINHGAVMISYLHSSEGVHGSSYYNPSEKTNHAVEIIGWDDNYSRSNFRNQPSSNGAWLIRNSWGEYGDENGCFWMSYEQNIGNATAYIIEDTIEGLRHYGHDELGSTSSVKYQWSANIFKAQDNEKIIEVGFYTKDNNVPYTIYINKLGSELPVNPGTLSSPVLSGTMANACYHALSLTNPIELEKGEYFSVILKSGKSSEYDYVSAIESRLRGSMVNEGESYFASSNTPVSSDWTDGKRISTGPFNACVKAFTVPSSTEIVKPSITSSRLPDGKTGERYSFTLTASGTNPITWSVSGLPEGLSLSNSTITGTPSKSGSFSVYVSAKNLAGSDTKTLSLTITSGNGDDKPGPDCSSFSGIHVLLALSIYAFMKKR